MDASGSKLMRTLYTHMHYTCIDIGYKLVSITTARMLHRHEYKELIWVDLESPTVDEVRRVGSEFNIDPSVAERCGCTTTEIRPLVECQVTTMSIFT